MNRTCSNCGSVRDLHFVTCGEPGSDFLGRTLLYCAKCRATNAHMVDVSWPIDLLTPEAFLALYRAGKTASDPSISVQLVFGERIEWLIQEIETILSAKEGSNAAA